MKLYLCEKKKRVEPDKALSPLKHVLKKETLAVLEQSKFDSTSSSLGARPFCFSSRMRGSVKDESWLSLASIGGGRPREREMRDALDVETFNFFFFF
jgi:hypothetical protein